MAFEASPLKHRPYHMVGLLQALPEFMSQLSTNEEAIALVQLILGTLARPSDLESRYVGLALQARFGVDLLGYSPDVLQARVRELSRTLFLIDSTTLIPLLARSSEAHSAANLLIDQLKAVGSTVATTSLLLLEVTEHAQWALSHVESNNGLLTTGTFVTATGRAGSRSNAFLEGAL